MSYKKILLLLCLINSNITAYFPGLENFSDREILKLRNGFLLSYIAKNLDSMRYSGAGYAGKYSGKRNVTPEMSYQAQIFILLVSIIITFEREPIEEQVRKPAPPVRPAGQVEPSAPELQRLKPLESEKNLTVKFKDWDPFDLSDLRKLFKNGICVAAGTLGGLIVPGVKQIFGYGKN